MINLTTNYLTQKKPSNKLPEILNVLIKLGTTASGNVLPGKRERERKRES
jgi:hypothetical protein